MISALSGPVNETEESAKHCWGESSIIKRRHFKDEIKSQIKTHLSESSYLQSPTFILNTAIYDALLSGKTFASSSTDNYTLSHINLVGTLRNPFFLQNLLYNSFSEA